jgi:uncharacterized membrane protein
LLFIVFAPFPTAVVVSAQSSWLPVAFYASNIACAGFALTLVWVYASYNFRLISASTPIREVRLSTLQGVMVPSVFLLSILVAFESPRLAEYFWLLSFVAQWAVARHREMPNLAETRNYHSQRSFDQVAKLDSRSRVRKTRIGA